MLDPDELHVWSQNLRILQAFLFYSEGEWATLLRAIATNQIAEKELELLYVLIKEIECVHEKYSRRILEIKF